MIHKSKDVQKWSPHLDKEHERNLNDVIEAPYLHPSKHVARHYTSRVFLYYSRRGVYVRLEVLSGSQNGVKGHANTAWHNGLDDLQEFLEQDSGSKTAYELVTREEVIDDSLVMTEFKVAPHETLPMLSNRILASARTSFTFAYNMFLRNSLLLDSIKSSLTVYANSYKNLICLGGLPQAKSIQVGMFINGYMEGDFVSDYAISQLVAGQARSACEKGGDQWVNLTLAVHTLVRILLRKSYNFSKASFENLLVHLLGPLETSFSVFLCWRKAMTAEVKDRITHAFGTARFLAHSKDPMLGRAGEGLLQLLCSPLKDASVQSYVRNAAWSRFSYPKSPEDFFRHRMAREIQENRALFHLGVRAHLELDLDSEPYFWGKLDEWLRSVPHDVNALQQLFRSLPDCISRSDMDKLLVEPRILDEFLGKSYRNALTDLRRRNNARSRAGLAPAKAHPAVEALIRPLFEVPFINPMHMT